MVTFVPLFYFILCCSILFDFSSSQLISKSNPTSQSTTYYFLWKSFPSSYAVDGDESTCSETERDDNQWWQVDLGRVYAIKKVIFSTYYPFFDEESIEFSLTEPFEIVRTDAVAEAEQNGNTFTFNFNVRARFVRIIKNHYSILFLCEVQVYE